jgi:hypothetical protein
MCEHEAIEQIRGLMQKADYFDVWARDAKYSSYADRLPENYAEIVELTKDNATDFRIICIKCHLTTGWMKADAPGYPGALKAHHRQKWDEIKVFTPEQWEAEQRKGAPRTETDVKKLFPDLEKLSGEHGRPVGGFN